MLGATIHFSLSVSKYDVLVRQYETILVLYILVLGGVATGDAIFKKFHVPQKLRYEQKIWCNS